MNRTAGLGGGGGLQARAAWPPLATWSAQDYQDTQANGSVLDSFLLGQGVQDADLYPGDGALDTPLLRVTLVLLYGVLAVAGFTSNVLVCCVVARQSARKSTAGKMIPRHLYIANLAAADVLICVLALPGTLWWLAHDWSGLGGGPGGGGAATTAASVALCRGLPALQCACAGAAAGTVAAIALDRYRAIVTRAHDASSSRRAVPRVIATIWAAACALAAPLVAFHDVTDVDGVPRCVAQWPAPAPAWRLSYACVRAVLHFLLPALSLCVVHTRISAYLHSRPMQWRRRRSRRTALVLGTVAAVFTFSWLPLTAFQLLVNNPGQHRVMFACCHLLAMSSTLSNPLLYGWLNSHFRREIRAMLPCCCAPGKDRHHRTVCK
ncbi:Orphan Neuropeptide Receptor 5, partial [Frankliniella occidentalis]